jgi:Transposase
MSQTLNSKIAVIGIDIGKNSFHIVGQDRRGALVLRQKWSRGRVEARLANLPPCLIGMEAYTGAHHLSRKLKALGHQARLMPAKYVRPYSKGQKNDFRDAEAIAEAVQRQHLEARQSLPARSVCAGGLGCAGQDKEPGTLRAQILDRSRQEAVASQRAGDRARQQACPDRLGSAG